MLRDGDGRETVADARRGDLPRAAALFLLAALARLVHVATVAGSPFATLLILDPRMYDQWGLAISRGQAWSSGVFFQDPLYAYFLAGVYALTGHHYLPVMVIQSLLGALVAPLLFLAARRGFGRGTATLAGLVAACYLPAIYYDGLILKTSLGTFLVALWLSLMAAAAYRRRRVLWVVAGAVLGLACLTRGNLLLMLPVAALWIPLDALPREGASPSAGSRLGTREGWQGAGLLMLGCVLVLAPVALRNRVVGSEWVLTTANAGQNFFIGNNPLNQTGEYQRLPFVDPNPKYEERDFAAEAARRTGHALGARETSRFWFGEARTWIASHPADWARLLWRKLRVFWGAFEVPDNLDYSLYRERAPVLRLPFPGFGLVAPLGLLGAFLAVRRPGWPRLLLLLLLVYSSSVVLFFVFSRFRMAMMPALWVLAAHGAVELWHAGAGLLPAGRPRRRALAVMLGFFALLGFVNLPVRGRDGSPMLVAAQAIGLPTQVEHAATGHFNLGVAYAARASEADDPAPWLALAEEELRRAEHDETRYAEVPIELGKVLAREGRDEEAVAAYLRALRLEPENYRIRHALGLLHRRLGDPRAAAEDFAAALALEPRSAASAVELGQVLLELGRYEEARSAFRRALELRPGDRRAAEGLGAAEARINGPSDPSGEP